MLILLDGAQQRGEALSPQQLRRAVHIGYDELGLVLDRLAAAGIVQRGQQDCWVLKKKLDCLSVGEVFRLFVYRAGDGVDAVASTVAQLFGPFTAQLEAMTLAEFARRVERK